MLNDLEDFIESDWKKIFEESKKEEIRKELELPVIPNFPHYSVFYKILVDSMHDPCLPSEIRYLIGRMVQNRERPSTKAFENLWTMFCDSRVTDLYYESCEECGRKYTAIVSKRPEIRFGGNFDGTHEVMMHSQRIHCSHCGCMICVIAGRLVGLFENRRIDE